MKKDGLIGQFLPKQMADCHLLVGNKSCRQTEEGAHFFRIYQTDRSPFVYGEISRPTDSKEMQTVGINFQFRILVFVTFSIKPSALKTKPVIKTSFSERYCMNNSLKLFCEYLSKY